VAESWLQRLDAWHDFYVICGSAAAGLTGLMFVVVSLGPKTIAAGATTGVRAFVTPTVVCFTSALVVSAVMTMPAMNPSVLSVFLAVGSIGALGYMLQVRGHRLWRENKLDRLDWVWYVGLPIVAYLTLLGTALAIAMRAPFALDVLGGAIVLLLVVGIRNAWDLVLWMSQQSSS
jgi:hypothetical protein